MDNQPAFDRSILIPIFISGCSVVGILVVLLVGRALNSPAEVPVTPSATRFQYVYIGTEPAITTPLVEETEEEPFPTEEPIEEPDPNDIPTPILTTPTRPGPLTPIILPSATGNLQRTNTAPPPTVTSASAPPLNPGTYDDVYPNLVYNGWSANNSGGTLHVSNVPGSTISFRFIGTQVRLLYQGGNTLGQVRITIDNTVTETLDQSSGTEWASDILSNGTHTILITHLSGGSVNLDQVIIPDPATQTPTPTPTRTVNAP
jgi:hypothetical protein